METKRVYLSLESSTGWLFEKSNTAKEGFEQHEYVPKSGENKDKTVTTYRKYHKFGIFGNFVGAKPDKFEKVWLLKICFENPVEGIQYIINFPIYDPKSNVGSFAQGFISYFPGIEVGRAYNFSPYVDDRSERKKYGINLWYARLGDNAVDRENKPPRLTLEYTKGDGKGGFETIPGDIPMTEWVEMDNGGGLDGNGENKPVADNKKKNAFLEKTLRETAKIKGEVPSGGGGATFDSSQEPSPTTTQQGNPAAQSPATKSEEGKGGAMAPNTGFDTPKINAEKVENEEDDDSDLPF